MLPLLLRCPPLRWKRLRKELFHKSLSSRLLLFPFLSRFLFLSQFLSRFLFLSQFLSLSLFQFLSQTPFLFPLPFRLPQDLRIPLFVPMMILLSPLMTFPLQYSLLCRRLLQNSRMQSSPPLPRVYFHRCLSDHLI